jgi:hypothetical protein
MLDFPDNPAPDEIFTTPKTDFIWKTGPGRWRRGVSPLVLTSLDPASVGSYAAPITVSYIGSGFDATCGAFEDGQGLPTTLISSTELQVTHTPSGFIGTKQCLVRRGADASAALPFEYVNSGSNPDIGAFNPTSLSSLDTSPRLVDCIGIGGGGTDNFFSPDAVVVMDGRDMPTTYQSVGLLRFEVTGSDWAPGIYQVIVRQIGGISDPPLDFTIG